MLNDTTADEIHAARAQLLASMVVTLQLTLLLFRKSKRSIPKAIFSLFSRRRLVRTD